MCGVSILLTNCDNKCETTNQGFKTSIVQNKRKPNKANIKLQEFQHKTQLTLQHIKSFQKEQAQDKITKQHPPSTLSSRWPSKFQSPPNVSLHPGRASPCNRCEDQATNA